MKSIKQMTAATASAAMAVLTHIAVSTDMGATSPVEQLSDATGSPHHHDGHIRRRTDTAKAPLARQRAGRNKEACCGKPTASAM